MSGICVSSRYQTILRSDLGAGRTLCCSTLKTRGPTAGTCKSPQTSAAWTAKEKTREGKPGEAAVFKREEPSSGRLPALSKSEGGGHNTQLYPSSGSRRNGRAGVPARLLPTRREHAEKELPLLPGHTARPSSSVFCRPEVCRGILSGVGIAFDSRQTVYSLELPCPPIQLRNELRERTLFGKGAREQMGQREVERATWSCWGWDGARECTGKRHAKGRHDGRPARERNSVDAERVGDSWSGRDKGTGVSIEQRDRGSGSEFAIASPTGPADAVAEGPGKRKGLATRVEQSRHGYDPGG